MTTLKTLVVSGRFWAYVGSILGATVSIAANIAHSYVPPDNAPDNWAPQPGAVVSAIVWPVFLFIAVEILARVAWPHGWTWQLLRWAGITPVAFVAALVSYRHLSGLLAYYSEESLVAILGPLAVDGLMVMATGALIATSHTTPTPLPTTANKPATHTTPANPNPSTGVAEPKEFLLTAASSTMPAENLPAEQLASAVVPARLISAARTVTVQHRQTSTEPITADELATRLNISPTIAGQLLTAIDNPGPARINGNTPALDGAR